MDIVKVNDQFPTASFLIAPCNLENYIVRWRVLLWSLQETGFCRSDSILIAAIVASMARAGLRRTLANANISRRRAWSVAARSARSFLSSKAAPVSGRSVRLSNSACVSTIALSSFVRRTNSFSVRLISMRLLIFSRFNNPELLLIVQHSAGRFAECFMISPR